MALSQHYRVLSRIASLLVLEDDDDYERYALDTTMAAFPDKSLVAVVEDALLRRQERQDDWTRIERAIRVWSKDRPGAWLADLMAVADDRALQLPDGSLAIPLLQRADVPEQYLQTRSHQPSDLMSYRDEAERRRKQDQLGAAVRALSSIVENNPGDAEAARLTAYRLQAWEQQAAAASLLLEVLVRRPYEPGAYRDLASALRAERPVLSSILYEAVLAGTWDERFLTVKQVVREEYALHIRDVTSPSSASTRALPRWRPPQSPACPKEKVRPSSLS